MVVVGLQGPVLAGNVGAVQVPRGVGAAAQGGVQLVLLWAVMRCVRIEGQRQEEGG